MTNFIDLSLADDCLTTGWQIVHEFVNWKFPENYPPSCSWNFPPNCPQNCPLNYFQNCPWNCLQNCPQNWIIKSRFRSSMISRFRSGWQTPEKQGFPEASFVSRRDENISFIRYLSRKNKDFCPVLERRYNWSLFAGLILDRAVRPRLEQSSRMFQQVIVDWCMLDILDDPDFTELFNIMWKILKIRDQCVCKCALVTRSPVHICVHQFGQYAPLSMRVNYLFLTLTFWSIISQTLAFSDNFCENICYFTPWLCSVCTSVHGSDFETRAEKEVKIKLMPITKVANIYLFF